MDETVRRGAGTKPVGSGWVVESGGVGEGNAEETGDASGVGVTADCPGA